MQPLYEIAAEYRDAANKLYDTDLDQQTIDDTLEGLRFPLEQKAISIAALALNMEATANAIKEAEQRQADRRRAIENRAKRLRDYLLYNMQAAGVGEIPSPMFALKVRNNPPAVVIEDEGLIPAQFKRVPDPAPPQPDKKAIKAAIDEGKEVPGATIRKSQRVDIK